MDSEFLRFLLQAVNMIGTFAIGIWLYLEKRNDKTNDRVDVLSHKVDTLDKDVAGLSVAAKAAPNHADLAKVYDAVNSLAKTVHNIDGENRMQSGTLRMIQNLLMHGRDNHE